MNIFIFTRDLRLYDNNLFKCCINKKTLPIFIFNPKQLKSLYASPRLIQFMIECLVDLNDELKLFNSKLHCFYGNPKKIITKLCKENKVKGIYIMEDYSPFAKNRKNELLSIGIDIFTSETQIVDNICHNMYKKFTYFYDAKKKIAKQAVPREYRVKNLLLMNYDGIDKFMHLSKIEFSNNIKGGRKNGLIHLKNEKQLSPYMKFGCISVAEIISLKPHLLRNIMWRDFYYAIASFNPNILDGHPNYRNIKWKTKNIQNWKDGKTGFLLCDAGMRQLEQTGFIENRVRLVVATVLIKLMLVNWREGEMHFAKKLLDYDWIINNLNWQSVLGGWFFGMPYFRVFNPEIQLKKHYKDCVFIKTWIPEIAEIPNEDLLTWNTSWKKYKILKPIENYDEAKKRFIDEFQRAFN